MNREILFRGMTKDGKWVEGSHVALEPYAYIVPRYSGIKFQPSKGCDEILNAFHVLPETVGQYTGLNDKNGNKIFEGDKYLAFGKDEPDEAVFWDGAFGYNSGRFGFIAFASNPNFMWYNNTCEKIEVIGNIHEQERK